MLRARKTIVTAAALIALALMGSAGAANSQQDKMKTCNAQASAKSLKGDDRKQFMSSCLSSASASADGNSQQEKMKTCNAQASAKSLKGDDRKQFMSSCLKGS
jgi:psiF repeat